MIINKVNALVSAQALLREGMTPILEDLKDTSIPLAERWEAFTLLVTNNILVREESYGDGHLDILSKGVDELTMYDDFHVDRHQTLTYPDMYIHIMEASGDYQKPLVQAREANLSTWMEAVLASGYSGFCYDW